MADSDAGEKTEVASEKRREEFREKGDIARSRDILSVLVLLSALAYFKMFGDRLWHGVASFMRQFFQLNSGADLGEQGLRFMFTESAMNIAFILAPLVLAVVVVSIGGSIAQTGVLFSMKPLEPDLSRLNIFTRFIKTFFNKQAAGNLVGSITKISIVALVVYLTVKDDGRHIQALSTIPLGAGIRFIIDDCLSVMLNVTLVLIIIAIADYAWNRYVTEEKMKMTKQEVKDEAKEQEGNPHMKNQQRRRAMELASGQLKKAVPTADVIVNNPTHISVALRYRQGVDAAPVVVAKGADLMAMRIRQLAKTHNIPMIENVPLARGLYRTVKVGRPVPSDFYRAVAEVLAFVYRLRTEKGSGEGQTKPVGAADSAPRRRVEDIVETGARPPGRHSPGRRPPGNGEPGNGQPANGQPANGQRGERR